MTVVLLRQGGPLAWRLCCEPERVESTVARAACKPRRAAGQPLVGSQGSEAGDASLSSSTLAGALLAALPEAASSCC
eukprot:15477120-Alexandrium_andersonii.AAC.1